MSERIGLSIAASVFSCAVGLAQTSPEVSNGAISQSGLNAMAALMREKANRSPEEAKVQSNLLHAMRAIAARRSGQASAVMPFIDSFIDAEAAPDGTVPIPVRAVVSDMLVDFVRGLGATNLAAFPSFDAITARMPIDNLVPVCASR